MTSIRVLGSTVTQWTAEDLLSPHSQYRKGDTRYGEEDRSGHTARLAVYRLLDRNARQDPDGNTAALSLVGGLGGGRGGRSSRPDAPPPRQTGLSARHGEFCAVYFHIANSQLNKYRELNTFCIIIEQ